MGQKIIDFVCTRHTVCGQWSEEKSEDVGVGVVRSGVISQWNYIFTILFTVAVLFPPGFFVICLLADAPIQSILLQRRSRTHTTSALNEARACSPGFSRPLPAARTHIVSHRGHPSLISSPPTGPQGLDLSARYSRTFSSSCSLFESLIQPRISVFPSVCSSIDHPISSPPLLPFISGLFSTGGTEKGVELFQLRARSQNLLHLDFITNRPATRNL